MLSTKMLSNKQLYFNDSKIFIPLSVTKKNKNRGRWSPEFHPMVLFLLLAEYFHIYDGGQVEGYQVNTHPPFFKLQNTKAEGIAKRFPILYFD